MKYDVAIIGAGVGGLVAANELKDFNVVVLEKLFRPGGTSYSFKRKDFEFLTGPLGFSHPEFVKSVINPFIHFEPTFFKTEYQLLAGDLDVVISKPLKSLQKDLAGFFPGQNIEKPVKELIEIIKKFRGVYSCDGKLYNAIKNSEVDKGLTDEIKAYYKPAYDYFSEFINDEDLLRLVSSIGMEKSDLSVISTAYMWDTVSETGIWYPTCGLKSLMDALYGRIKDIVKLGMEVRGISYNPEQDFYALKSDSGTFLANYVVSDMDFKNLYGLLDEELQPKIDYAKKMEEGSSVLTVYAGIDIRKIDRSRVNAHHVLYYPYLDEKNSYSSNSFYRKEIEVTFLSDYGVDSGTSVKDEKGELIIRTSFDYDSCKFGKKEQYYSFKERISKELLDVVEPLIPGLNSSIKVMDTSTPLTYETWGGRFRGSVIGWNWEGNISECLVRTPAKNFFSCGIYSFTVPFLGAFPTSAYSGKLVADYIRYAKELVKV